ncbi:DUF2802 domain-containing protein [Idiomarina sp. 017G]|uniref:DUF2802 domain-containing protein n=1 Tax=Idiomarina sp. 017G TaxID=2183988 RepID=UPI000E0EFB99|nr:DUF2802 domain-containing protein [Idiomarina sp. 017G]|tara:strand:+ start:398 stop:850 length:453 start_codon:yes stop_codon:yes gene_type:complete
MMTNWLFAISALALGLALIALVAVVITSRRQAELIERQQQRLLMLTETASEVLSLREQFKQQPSEAPSKTDFAQQQVVAQLQQQVAQLNEEQQQLQQRLQEVAEQDPSSKLYQRAAKLVASGASVEELMQECDLPQAEAELLTSLHKKGA